MTHTVGPVKVSEAEYVAESVTVVMQFHAQKLRYQMHCRNYLRVNRHLDVLWRANELR